MVPTSEMALVMTPFSFRNVGGLYSSSAFWAYSPAHRAKARFSAPDSLIFWMPLTSA